MILFFGMKIYTLVVCMIACSLALTWCSATEFPTQSISDKDVGQENIQPINPAIVGEDGKIPPVQSIITEFKTTEDNILTLREFAEMDLIVSPQRIEGTVPSDWVFEWNFPVTLMTLEEEIIKERYWIANIFDTVDQVVEDNLDFTATIDFALPEDLEDNIVKIRFEGAMLRDAEQNNEWDIDMVEVMVVLG